MGVKEATHPHYKQINTPRQYDYLLTFTCLVKELKKQLRKLPSLRKPISKDQREEYGNAKPMKGLKSIFSNFFFDSLAFWFLRLGMVDISIPKNLACRPYTATSLKR